MKSLDAELAAVQVRDVAAWLATADTELPDVRERVARAHRIVRDQRGQADTIAARAFLHGLDAALEDPRRSAAAKHKVIVNAMIMAGANAAAQRLKIDDATAALTVWTRKGRERSGEAKNKWPVVAAVCRSLGIVATPAALRKLSTRG